MNAKAMVKEIVAVLSKEDPANKEAYAKNGVAIEAKLDQLVTDTDKALHDYEDAKYVVFHDAYQYFEKRFHLKPSGVVTLSPEIQPGAAQLKELREEISEEKVSCVFSEPQFPSAIPATLVENTSAKVAVLDPLGSSIEAGPEMYFQLIASMSASFQDCLSETG